MSRRRRKGEPIHFVVRGAGDFPLDMLRYDSCYPLRSEDVRAMEDTESGVRDVTLESKSERELPTVGRWHSFGWEVRRLTDTERFSR